MPTKTETPKAPKIKLSPRQTAILTAASKKAGYKRVHDRGEGMALYHAERKDWIKPGADGVYFATEAGKAALKSASKPAA